MAHEAPPTNMANRRGMNHSCRDPGTLFEHLFFTEALKRGLVPFLPINPRQVQDCLVLNQSGKIYKVQVKGTHTTVVRSANCKRFCVQAVQGRTVKTPIDCTKIDILVAYIEPEDTYYIIPCIELEGVKSLWFYSHNPNSKGRLEKYRDRWDLFRV